MNALFDHYPLSAEQQAPVLSQDRDVVVVAGAGTGKTRTLVGRFLALTAAGVPLRQIVAITFTRKAAREMRNRVRRELEQFLQEAELSPTARRHLAAQRDQLDAARISTIHTFCAEILRNHPAEAQLDPRFRLLDEAEAALARAAAVDQTLGWAADDPRTVPLFADLGAAGLRDALSALLQQRLDAGAAFAVPGADPLYHWRTLLEQRQAECLGRIWTSSRFTGALALLRSTRPLNDGDGLAQQRALALRAVGEAEEDRPVPDRLTSLASLDDIVLNRGSQKAWPSGNEDKKAVKDALRTLRDLWRETPLLRLRLNAADERLAQRLPDLFLLFENAQNAYQALKAADEALDFDDLEALALRLLQTTADVRTTWQERIQALLVDEFQDTNERQRELIAQLCERPGKLFIVGDAKQSIYRFRGADVTVFRAERERIGRTGGVTALLDTSYRAHAPLIAALNGLLRPILGEPDPRRPAWEEPFAPLRPARRESAGNLPAPYVEFLLAAGSKGGGALDTAADVLVERLRRLTADGPFTLGDVAILCRSTRAFAAYENALDRAGLPYLTVSGRGFYERPEVRDLVNALTAIADPTDDLALLGLLRSPAGGLSDEALFHLVQARPRGTTLWNIVLDGAAGLSAADGAALARTRELLLELGELAGRAPVADVLKAVLDRSGYRAALIRAGLPRAVRNVDKLLDDAHAGEQVSVPAFLSYLGGVRDVLTREGEARAVAEGAVQIMTIHAAKGLEFPVVVIGDINAQGPRARDSVRVDEAVGVVLPLVDELDEKATAYVLAANRDAAQEEAEAARLLYVAATRAEELLIFSGNVGVQESAGSLNRLNGWLGTLAGLVGLDRIALDGFAADGAAVHDFDLSLGECPIQARIVEPAYALPAGPAAQTMDVLSAAECLPTPGFLAPLIADGDLEDEPPRIWRVVNRPDEPASTEPPGWLIGQLVHEALSAWRFPDEAFDAWLHSRARSYGLHGAVSLQRAAGSVRELLLRLRQHPLHAAISAANQRLHEVPYSLPQAAGTEFGTIDLLFRRGETWIVVDFKTDHLSPGANLAAWAADHGHIAQVRRYGGAVRALWGVSPRLQICFLDAGGRVVVHEP